MLLLFALAVTCFLVLFAALLVLLQRALRSGTLHAAPLRRSVARVSRMSRRTDKLQTTDNSESRGLPVEFEKSLSNIVPGKRPDWRFMVTERRRASARLAGLPGKKSTTAEQASHSARPDWAYFNADMGDLRDPYQTAEPPAARRA